MKKVLLASLIFIGCENVKVVTNPLPQPNGPFDIQGHRGARGLMPENTIPAFLKAIDVGATTLEMDAAITKDDKVIISHDPFFNHDITIKPDGSAVSQAEEKVLDIYKMTYEEVEKYDVGSKGNYQFPQQAKMKVAKPLLADVIDAAEAHAVQSGKPLPLYNIEIKSTPPSDNVLYPGVEKYTDLLMTVVVGKKIESRVIIQSFDTRALKYMHTKYPGIKLALNADVWDKKTLAARLADLGFTPYIFSPNYKLVDAQLVAEAKQDGIKVIPFTVNEVADMKRMKDLGVNGIITDYPNLAKDIQ